MSYVVRSGELRIDTIRIKYYVLNRCDLKSTTASATNRLMLIEKKSQPDKIKFVKKTYHFNEERK